MLPVFGNLNLENPPVRNRNSMGLASFHKKKGYADDDLEAACTSKLFLTIRYKENNVRLQKHR